MIEGGPLMQDVEIKLRVTLTLDEKWARNHTQEELADYIKERMNSSLGFRGQIKKFAIAKKRNQA